MAWPVGLAVLIGSVAGAYYHNKKIMSGPSLLQEPDSKISMLGAFSSSFPLAPEGNCAKANLRMSSLAAVSRSGLHGSRAD